MAYIADLDPQRHDPALDLPFRCPECEFTGTVEDTTVVHETGRLARARGLMCPRCHLVAWDDDPEPPEAQVYVAEPHASRRPYGLPDGAYCVWVWPSGHAELMFKPAGERTFLPALPLALEA